MKYFNPVIRGMYPDPSFCRAKEKFYMVCSSFCYFPGIPLFESCDLINWKQIGCCLTQKSQLPLKGADAAGGIYAPTIRYFDGRFYVVSTNVTSGKNFFVWTSDIYGKWSDPIQVEQDGIDPSLFFDDDGKSYFLSNGGDDEGRPCIQMCEIDIQSGKKISERKILWHGTGGRFIEAPHLYKFFGTYYLLDAEGGTEYGHMENCAKSKNIFGPYESCPHNPVLTNRNLGGYILQGAGHADIVQAADGTWWLCHLAFRQIGKWLPFHHLGREVCVESVEWKDGWFFVGKDGTSRAECECPALHKFSLQKLSYKKTFENLSQKCDWIFLRNPVLKNYEFGKNEISICGTKYSLEEKIHSPSFVAIRQCEFEEKISVTVEPKNQEAGLSIFMDAHHHYDIFAKTERKKTKVCARLRIGPALCIAGSADVEGSEARLLVEASAQQYSFFAFCGGKKKLLAKASSSYLSSEVAGGFTGVVEALFAFDAEEKNQKAVFKDFCVSHISRAK